MSEDSGSTDSGRYLTIAFTLGRRSLTLKRMHSYHKTRNSLVVALAAGCDLHKRILVQWSSQQYSDMLLPFC